MVWICRGGLLQGCCQDVGANVVPDGDTVNVEKTWAVPESSQGSRHTAVLSIRVSQKI